MNYLCILETKINEHIIILIVIFMD